jgi:hypothetical protein
MASGMMIHRPVVIGRRLGSEDRSTTESLSRPETSYQLLHGASFSTIRERGFDVDLPVRG